MLRGVLPLQVEAEKCTSKNENVKPACVPDFLYTCTAFAKLIILSTQTKKERRPHGRTGLPNSEAVRRPVLLLEAA